MASSTSSWPPPEGTTTPIMPREKAIVKMHGSTRIAAPASLVFRYLMDSSSYPQWNTFIPKVTIRSQPEGEPAESTRLVKGTHFTYHCAMDASKPDSLREVLLKVNDISTPDNPSSYIPQSTLDSEPCYSSDLSKVYRASWTSEEGLMTMGLRAERFHEIIILGEKECEVRTWECQGGILGYVVNMLYAQTLMDKFTNWVAELKKITEENA